MRGEYAELSCPFCDKGNLLFSYRFRARGLAETCYDCNPLNVPTPSSTNYLG